MTTVIHVFTEEPSAKNVFDILLPRILPADITFRVYTHQGKQDLEKALKKTVPSISRIPGSKILITRDQDNTDCVELKNKLLEIVNEKCQCDFYIRIICKELESWFLGDFKAIKSAYPRFRPENYIAKKDLRNVDKVVKPSKYLLKILPEYSGRNYLPKLEVSESIARYLNLEENRSPSFNNTITAVKKLLNL